MPFRGGVCAIALFAAALVPLQLGICQTKGGTTGTPGGSGAGTGTTGTTGATGVPTSTTTTTTTNNTPNVSATPVFISGRVMLDDGTAPTESVAIERVCLSVTRTEGYTDTRGYFAVQLGNERGVFQDASEDTSRSTRSIMGGSGSSGGSSGGNSMNADRRFNNCDIRARLPGYRSQSVSLATHRAMDNPDIGVILLHREGRDEGTTISMVSLLAPKEARKAFEKGLSLEKKNKMDEAEKEFRRAVELYPKYAAAWNEIGKIQISRNEYLDARRSFDQAINADPKFLNPFAQISIMAMQARKWQELADVTDRAMRLDPFEYPQIYLFNGVANYNLKRMELSQRAIEAAAKLDTLQQMPEISHLQGLLLIQKRDYAAAAERLRNYLKLAPDAEDAAVVRTQLEQIDRALAENAAKPGDNPGKQ